MSKEEKENKIEKVHYFVLRDRNIRYLCNEACSVTKGKYTNDFFDITCSKCKSMLVKDSIKNAELKGFQEGTRSAKQDEIKMIDERMFYLKRINALGRYRNGEIKELELLKSKLQEKK